MATTTGAARYNQPVKYGKSLTMTMADGTTKVITGTQAQRIQKYLEDNPRFIYFLEPDTGKVTFYALSDSGCGFCQVAVYQPSATTADPADCEDGLPNCPDDSDNPTTASLTVDTQLVQVEVGKTATVTATAVPDTAVLSWASAAEATATVANGVITGVKAGNTTVTVTAKASSASDAATLATQTITVMVVPAGSLVNPITGGSTANK